MKKILLLVLAAAMVLATGCGVATKETGGSEEITLTWVMPGPGEQEDSQKVWNEFNKRLKEYPGMENINVEVEVINSSEYAQKFLLMQTGNSNIDIAQTYTLNFAKEARNGTFIPLDAMLEKTPKLVEAIPEMFWGLGKVDGVTYIVPIYQQMCSALWGFVTPKSLADKYLDLEAAQASMYENDALPADSLDVIDAYLKALKDNGEIQRGFAGVNPYIKDYEMIEYPYGIRVSDEKPVIVNVIEEESTAKVFEYASKWYKEGYISKDILSVTPEDYNGKVNGNTLWIDQVWKGTEAVNLAKYGFETTSINLADYSYIPSKVPAGGTAIMTSSKHPEESMRLIELMNSEEGKDLYNLMVYGIEGEHYTMIGDDRVKPTDYAGIGTSGSKYGLWKWIVGNAFYAYDTDTDPEDWKEYVFEELNMGENTKYSKLIGFQADLTKIETKLAQVGAVNGEFGYVLVYGASDDWKKTYEEYLDKLDKCGNKEIMAEFQSQIDAFLASNN